MTVESLQTLSLIFFILAGVLFLVTVALFFLLNIVKVFGYLTGINAKRAIEDIRVHNEVPESIRQSSKEKVTSKFSISRKLQKDMSNEMVIGTSKLSTSKLIKEAMETTALDQNATTVLDTTANETTVLDASANETTVLSGFNFNSANVNRKDNTLKSASNEINPDFYIEYEIYFAESTEVIR